jgi:hypothetical protein
MFDVHRKAVFRPMKSLLPSDIDKACQRYAALKTDKEYKACYKGIIGLRYLSEHPRFESENVFHSLQSYMLLKWKLKYVLSPFLRVRLDDKLTSSKSLQLILGAFGLIEDTSYIYNYFTRLKQRKGPALSKEKLEVEKRSLQTAAYMMHETLKIKVKRVARFLDVHHSTVGEWVDEIKMLSEKERHDRITELQTGNPLRSTDVLGEENRYKRSSRDVETIADEKNVLDD